MTAAANDSSASNQPKKGLQIDWGLHEKLKQVRMLSYHLRNQKELQDSLNKQVFEIKDFKPVVKIEIASDTVCASSFVAKRNVEQAISLAQVNYPDITFEVHWVPFFVNSQVSENMKLSDFYRKLYPDEDKAEKQMAAVKASGIKQGINFTMEGKIGNTINSHRLAQLGYNEGGFELQNKIIEGIFSGYYEKGQDVSSIDFLVSVAESVGLDGDKVRTFLNGSEQLDELKEQEQSFRTNHQVAGIPAFIINGQKAWFGKQDPEMMQDQLEQIAESILKPLPMKIKGQDVTTLKDKDIIATVNMETKSVAYRFEGPSLSSMRAQNEALNLDKKMEDNDLSLEQDPYPIDEPQIEFTVVHMDDESNKIAKKVQREALLKFKESSRSKTPQK